MTYRKKPQKYDIIWDRKLRRKSRKLERQFDRQNLEYMYWWAPRHLHRKKSVDWAMWYRYRRAQHRVEKKYYSIKRRLK